MDTHKSNNIIANRDILVTGLQSIDSKLGSNAVNLAIEFSKRNRVLYINYPLDRKTEWRYKSDPEVKKRLEIIQGKAPDLVKISSNLWTLYPKTILESISQVPTFKLFTLLNKINNKRFCRKIKEAIDKLGFSDIIWFNDSDFYRLFYLKKYISVNASLYYSRDNMIATPYFRKHGAIMEGLMMQKSDAVVTNSVYLQKYALKFNDNSFYVGQGCDITAFNKELVCSVPSDIAKISKPIIGYIGAVIKLRLDIDLIEFLASRKPEWNFVFVGPEDDHFLQSKLHQMANVYFLGSKNQSELPSYLYSFNVAFNPQAINEITIGNYPRKIDEYLAMGKPVVATYTEAMQVFKHYVYLATSYSDFLFSIQNALDEKDKTLAEQRERLAKEHTWEVNANEIYKVINMLIEKEKS